MADEGKRGGPFYLTKPEIVAIFVLLAALFIGLGVNYLRIHYFGPNLEVTTAPESEIETKIDINSATREELTLLPGIGETLAQRIVDYRQKNGPFEKIYDLSKVRGIRPGLVKDIEGFVTVE